VFVPLSVSFTEAEARAAIAAASSYSDALRRLGLRPAGGNHATLKKYAERIWLIPVDHFDPAAARRAALRREPIPWSQVLVRDSRYSRQTLKKRLYAEGLKERRCELCGQGESWHGRRMALILDTRTEMPPTTGSRTCRSCARTALRRSTRTAAAICVARRCARRAAGSSGGAARNATARASAGSVPTRRGRHSARSDASNGRRMGSCSQRWQRPAGVPSGASTA
jgi:hypothetical protein